MLSSNSPSNFSANRPCIMPSELDALMDSSQLGDHICMFYESSEERDMIASHFIMIGLGLGERVLYIDREEDHFSIIQALRKLSVDAGSLIASGQLSILSRKTSYLSSGYFNPDQMIKQLEDSAHLAKGENFSGLRIVGDVPHSDGCDSMIEKIVSYETRLNRFFPKSNALALCLYDRSLFSETSLSKIHSAHPLVLHDNAIHKNSDYALPKS